MKMRMFSRFLACFTVFMYSSILFADVEIEKGRTLFTKGDIWGALEIFSACLHGKIALEERQLVECLYLGEKAADQVILSINRKGCRKEDLAKFRKLGLKVQMQKYFDVYCEYDSEFFRTLRKKFPFSPYRAEVEFMHRGGCNVYVPQGWKDCEKAELKYIEEFSGADYVIRAKLELAHLYDNLWEHLTDLQGPVELVGTGNAEQDKTLAEESRYKALILYHDILQSASIFITDDEYRMAMSRYAELQARIPGHVFYGLSID